MATNIFELFGIISIQNSDANKSIQDTASKARGLSGTLKGGALSGKVTLDNKTANDRINDTSGKVNALSGDLKGDKLDGEITVKNTDANSDIADTSEKVEEIGKDLDEKLDGEIKVKNTEANLEITNTKNKVENFHEKMKAGIEKAGKWALGIATAAATATTAIVAGINKVVGSAASTADAIDKGAQKLGISRKAYQEWDYTLALCGLEMEKMNQGMKGMQSVMKAVGDGSEDAIKAFHALGLSVYGTDGKMKDAETMFTEIVSVLASMEDGSERTQLAMKLFGEVGAEMAPLFNSGTEGIKQMIEQANELGLILSDEDIAKGVTYTDAVTTMRAGLEGIKNALGIALIDPMQAFAEYVIEKTPTIKEKIAEWEEPIRNTAVALKDGLIYLVENPEAIAGALTLIGAAFATWLTVAHPYVAAFTAVAGAIGALVVAGADGESQTDKFNNSLKNIDNTLSRTIRTEEEKAKKGETLIDVIESLAKSTSGAATDQETWNAAVNELIKLYPGLRDQINLETGEIQGGTEALRARITEYKNLAIEQAKQKALQDKYDALATAYKDAAALEVEVAVKTAKNDQMREEFHQLNEDYAYYKKLYGKKLLNPFSEESIHVESLKRQIEEMSPEYIKAGHELRKAQKDLEALYPAIEAAENDLALYEKAMEKVFGEEGNSIQETINKAEESIEAAEKSMEESAEEINAATEALNTAKETQPEIAENGEKALQEELNDMSLSVSVMPTITRSSIVSGVGGVGGGGYNVALMDSAYGPLLNGLGFPGHADGLDYVPYDNYVARLHKGEKVLTAQEASAYRSGEGNGMIVAAINALAGLLQQIIANTGAGQQIVLDTGILAGALAGPMNQQLGTIAARQGRRN